MSQPRKHVDLIIVGGGVLGAFHAFHAAEMGLKVLVLEKNAQPRGATTQNFGQVVPSGMNTAWQKFGRDSLEIYRSIQSKFDITVRQLGSIYIASDDDEEKLIEELHAINQASNYPSELWTRQQCRQRYPQLRADYCRSGLFFPEELSVNPRQMIHRLWKYLSQKPLLNVRFATCVSRLCASSDSVEALCTNGECYSSERALVCSGSDFQLLFPELFRQSDLKLVKLQMLRLKCQSSVSIPGNVLTGLSIRRYESFAQCPSWSEIKSREPDDAFWKKWGVHILFKQESDGGIILGDSHEYASVADADTLSCDSRTQINDYFVKAGRRIFDLPNWDVETSWNGFYCQTDDPSGILHRVIDDRIHFLTGIGGKGMTSSAGFSKYFLHQIYNPIETA